ncbi:MAG: MmgE/PrpD family protein [Aristaeellaceae bacterium]
MSELRTLAAFITGFPSDQVPAAVREATVLRILDAVGVGAGAAKNAQIQSVSRAWLEKGGHAQREADVWGQGRTAPVSDAVFLNAMMAHTLELDDVHTGSKTHIGTVVVPAAYGLAQMLGSSGRELIDAVLCGYEVTARIGMALGVSAHRNRGWHATSTAGTFGAAAACARLLGLSEDQTVSALGMAGTQSFGLWAFLGDSASSKVLHPARAAQSGMEAALLAQAGMTGPEHILTARDGGLLAAMSDDYDVSRVTEGLGTAWEILRVDNKPYPCCRSTHCAIDAALALRRDDPELAGKIDHAVVHTYLVGNKQCGMSQGSRDPHTAVEAKFSTPYTAAAALLQGDVTLRDFLPESIERPEARALLGRIRVETDDGFTAQYPDHWGCRMEVFLKDGSTRDVTVADASGSVSNPLKAEQVCQKARGLFAEVMTDAAGLADRLLALESATVLPRI